MQMWYWEKIYFNENRQHMHVEHSRRLRPLIQHWDEEKARERSKSTFGEGEVSQQNHILGSPLSLTVHPIIV